MRSFGESNSPDQSTQLEPFFNSFTFNSQSLTRALNFDSGLYLPPVTLYNLVASSDALPGAPAVMSAAPTSRAVFRQSRFLLRRNNFRQASTASEAASKAQDSGKQAVSKASEGLSRVQSSAGSTISRVGSSAYSALGRVGGRTGRMISFVECMSQAFWSASWDGS